MDSANLAQEVLPYLRVYRDGTIHRLIGTDSVPPNPDSDGAVSSKDVLVSEQTGVSARIYRPNSLPINQKLPLLVYFHGGAFCISSPSDPPYHNTLNAITAAASVVAVSVGYRKAPEHPLPAAYDDAAAALRWVSAHVDGEGTESWLREGVDFRRVFLGGDSAGANIAHHMVMGRVEEPGMGVVRIQGIIMIHPYFWGEEAIGSEAEDPAGKAMVDAWWRFVCRSERGCDDPLINPFVEGGPCLEKLGCERVLVCVAEKDILRERGCLYYEEVVKSGWQGKAELVETRDAGHVFHIFDPKCEKAVELFDRFASFINQ